MDQKRYLKACVVPNEELHKDTGLDQSTWRSYEFDIMMGQIQQLEKNTWKWLPMTCECPLFQTAAKPIFIYHNATWFNTDSNPTLIL